ncbi:MULTISPECIES: extracellular solute-binding protein [unclassified Mesorhizobium]|uniref:ABC transporter substrate-binding protein n=1 Tax=unclassified Mesorhizobium TaxID=325217 RepID=UPI0003CEABD1|nr:MULTISPECIES: extracellular solute-binding protein [unclassified Mesorhizobium]ESY51364.1 ABC transporter substrate-binding protein [Mesorhizobium sp. LNJC374B00]ESY56680.1 ABC transporter substrate-binding protein [Mesorhizobium sp. LNJC372A00]WJI81963.1 extracellular solute-binding protein [Mesorhizobium sp. C374B]WJI88483.1 extracellular solute-binding protein [Mesorhizobium sp. C372A]
MQRRTLVKTGLGLAALPLLPRLSFADDKKPVGFWYESASPENQDNLKTILIDPFNAAHPEDDLSIDFRGSDLDKQLRIAMLSGNGPDVVFTAGPSYVASMAQAGQLLPLDDYAAKLGWNDRLLPLFTELGKYEGKLYALAKTYETLGLFYNKTLFDKSSWKAPTTIAELEALADEMKAKGLVPFGAGNADWRPANEHHVSIVLNSVAGPDNVYKALTGAIPWTDPSIQAAIDKLDEWWQKGYFGPNYFSLTLEQAFAQVATGQAGMAPSGTWSFTNVPTYFPPNNAEPAFVGFPSTSGPPVYALGIGSTLSVNAKSENPDGAAAVLDYIFSDTFYGAMNSAWQGEWNLPLKDLSGVKLSDKVLPLYTESMKNLSTAVGAGQYGYTTWTFLPPATDTYLVSGMEEVWLKKISSKDYLKKLDETFQQEKTAGKVPAAPKRA